MRNLIAAAVLFAGVGAASADVTVRFSESAPKDSFTITNEGTCPLSGAVLTLDLSASASGLIFDVTASGAGVSVFQPLEVVSGNDFLDGVPEVKDGDNRLVLSLRTLAPGDKISFTIDVDDTAGRSETMVSGAEISGARVVFVQGASEVEAVFAEDAVARVPVSGCSA